MRTVFFGPSPLENDDRFGDIDVVCRARFLVVAPVMVERHGMPMVEKNSGKKRGIYLHV